MNLLEVEKTGYVGIDVSLEISLFEYGLVWWWDKENQEWVFIYGLPASHKEEGYTEFSYGGCKDIEDYDWADFKEMAERNSISLDEWLALPLPQQVNDLLTFYGTESVFGTCYEGGFTIENPLEGLFEKKIEELKEKALDMSSSYLHDEHKQLFNIIHVLVGEIEIVKGRLRQPKDKKKLWEEELA